MLSSLACAIVFGQFSDQKVSFTAKFEPIGSVVERLAAQTRTPMVALGELKNYPIYINVKDVSLSELMKKIAAVAGAEWHEKSQSYQLSTELYLRNEQTKAGDPELIAAIDHSIGKPPFSGKSLEEMFSEADPTKEPTPDQIQKAMEVMTQQLFGVNHISQPILKQIGAKGLSTIADGRRVVLSNDPTAMQGRLPAEVVNMLKTALLVEAKAVLEKREKRKKEREKEAAKAGKSAAKTRNSTPPKRNGSGEEEAESGIQIVTTPGEEPGEGEFTSFLGAGMFDPTRVSDINTVMISFQIRDRFTLNSKIMVFDSKRESLYSKQIAIEIKGAEFPKPIAATGDLVNPNGEAAKFARAIRDGKEIDPFMKAMLGGGIMGGGLAVFGVAMPGSAGPIYVAPEPLSFDIREKMLDPLKYDPLAITLNEVLDHEVKKGNQVVALPSDAVIDAVATALADPKQTFDGVLQTIDRSLGNKVTQDGSWTIVQASSPVELRASFCDRVALANLLKAGAQKGYLSLDDCSKFAFAQGNARGSELLAQPITTAVLRTSDIGSSSSLTSNGFDSLKFYATLDVTQRARVHEGKPLNVASFSPQQMEILGRMIYNGVIPPYQAGEGNGIFNPGEIVSDVAASEGKDSESDGMIQAGLSMVGAMGGMFDLMSGSSYGSERTVMMPNGVPNSGVLTAKTVSSTALVAINSQAKTSLVTAPEMLAMTQSERTAGGFNPFAGMKRTFDSYKLAKQKSLLLVFQFSDKRGYFASLYDLEIDHSKTYTMDTLPKSIKDRYDSMAKMEEDMTKSVPESATKSGKVIKP